FGQLYNISMHH
ncbi:secD/SecF GG Motif family protein, partial [Chlamydia psittaci C1/97]